MYFGKVKKKRDDGRVPPNQNVTASFPVLHYGSVPNYGDSLTDWDLKVFGEVEEEKTYSFKDILRLPQFLYENDIHCVTGWSKLDNSWEGVAAISIAEEAGIKDAAKFVILHAEEGWTTNLPLKDFLQDTSLLAHSLGGKRLSPEHGYPLRAVIPHLYFWKSAKWLRGIEFSKTDQPGFWEKNGYHNYGDPWKEERLSWD
ncbi:sulfite oxidase-like oxidoreductase [Falsibacillus albus]|uniref:Sulfite oxidase-like oxidoreductase n=1 Tax=Falsibacillus albus TaxID=2478915 RepID=A0A3L7K0D2_9BACI|nr:sulfite oxidase-like oxidoreductase [Falsibacillus albus]RLQ96513.1 sulfite oxidase-like oxidoreductase [Falsibacillus albus]